MTSSDPVRVLLICHLPLRRALGGARVQLEFGEELRRLGHSVDHYTLDEAFPDGPPGRFSSLLFSQRASRHVRAVGHRYDIIEGHQGDVPRSKAWLKLDGLLVVRSSGLFHAYNDFQRRARLVWPELPRGTLPGRGFRELHWRWLLKRTERTFREADLINVPNDDERTRVEDMVGSTKPVVAISNGIAPATLLELRERAGAIETRRAALRVSVIGTWDARKGARDWPFIVRRVWGSLPSTRFAFLGTSASEGRVRRDLGCEGDTRIEVVPTFRPETLPRLLEHATVGALPSHIEGFGLGLVESLGAGLPSIAYDVPGPRETIGKLQRSWLTPAGDHDLFARKLVELLGAPATAYAQFATESTQFAQRYSWEIIAPQTLAAYRTARDG
jgi:glycosyltransferase involved in cell wall biosynthesis